MIRKRNGRHEVGYINRHDFFVVVASFDTLKEAIAYFAD